jgi:hypothetical protein
MTDPKTRTFLEINTRDERAHGRLPPQGPREQSGQGAEVNFQGIPSDPSKFAATAYVLENTAVHAYLG